MIRLLQWFFLGHIHKWKTLEQHNIVDWNKRICGAAHIQQCEHCGTVRRRDLT